MNKESQSISSSNVTTTHTDVELDHSAEQKIMNVEFVEEQPIVSDDARLGTSLNSLPKSQESQMPDASWLAAQQLSKPIVLQRLTWSTNQGGETELSSLLFPNVLRQIDTLHQETLRMYAFYKFNWVLRFQLNGTKFHSGQLICSWDPFSLHMEGDTAFGRPFSRYTATGLPHILLNASTNEPSQITIPFVHPKNFLSTNSSVFDNLGTFRITVLNQLKAAEGSSSTLHLTVWFYAESPSVHVPIYRHELVPPPTVTTREILHQTLRDREKSLRTSLNHEVRSTDIVRPSIKEVVTNSFTSFLDGMLGDDFSKLRQTTTKTVGNIATGNWGQALRNGGKAAGHLADFLNLDYPVRLIMSLTNINPIGPMAIGRGVDSSHSLRLDPAGSQVIDNDRKGNTVEECDVDFIKKVPMILDTVPWSDTRTSGSILAYWPVTPNICGKILNFNTNTYLSYLSGLFQFWRGGLKYRIELVSTQFHTGRLLVAFIPNAFTDNPTFEQALSCPSIVIDLQQNSSVTFNVPFVSQTPFKSTDWSGNTDLNLVGYVYVYVLNDLVHPANVANDVEFNIYISADDDFEFAVPKYFNYDLRLRSNDIVQPSIENLDRIQTRTGESNEASNLNVAFGPHLIPFSLHFGEIFTLLDVMKRYARYQRYTDTSGSRSIRISNKPTYAITPDDPDTRLSPSPLAVVSAMFACWFGSIRYKFVTNANRNCEGQMSLGYLTSPATNPVTPDNFALDGFCAPIQRTNLDQNNALEIDVPCYTPYNLVVNRLLGVNDALLNDDEHRAGFVQAEYEWNAEKQPTLQVDVYKAAGDDYRPFYLIAPPADYTESTVHYSVTIVS